MVSREVTNVQEVLSQFRRFSKALIDASSIIYMQKAGFFMELASSLNLYSLQEILAETGFGDLKINRLACNSTSLPNDQKFIACALVHRFPVISEDKKILSHMKKEKIPYFNALMMLNFLLFRERISVKSYSMYFERLKHFAWYSSYVLEFSIDIYSAILKERNK